MDYVIGFLLGYFFKEAYQLIERISNYDHNNINKEWDFLSHDDLP